MSVEDPVVPAALDWTHCLVTSFSQASKPEASPMLVIRTLFVLALKFQIAIRSCHLDHAWTRERLAPAPLHSLFSCDASRWDMFPDAVPLFHPYSFDFCVCEPNFTQEEIPHAQRLIFIG